MAENYQDYKPSGGMANAGPAALASPHKTSLSSEDYAQQAAPAAGGGPHSQGAGKGSWVECIDVMTLSMPSNFGEAMNRAEGNLAYYRGTYFAFTMVTMVAFRETPPHTPWSSPPVSITGSFG